MNQPQTFAIGDLVMLKSWSPKMTVEKLEKGRIDVVWFDCMAHTVQRDSFPSDTLELWVDQAVRDRLAAMAEQGIDVSPA